MKKVMVINLFLLLTFSISLLYETKAQQNDPRCCDIPCYDNQYCSNPGPWVYQWTEVELPQFPGCTMTVEFCTRRCENNECSHTIQIKICKVHFLYSCQPCELVWQFVAPEGRLNARRVRMLFTEIIKQITLESFVFFYEGLPQELKERVECGVGCHAKYQWWKGSCVAYCYYTKYDDQGNLRRYIKSLTCYSDLCCGIEFRYCYNSQEQRVERTEIRLTDPQVDCSTMSPPPGPCDPGSLDEQISECGSECEDI